MNGNIVKTQIIYIMKFDLKGHLGHIKVFSILS